ncbi:MAG: M48 family metalloprotease [Candidatus Brockarchaeota archaeon]|nr:M48 family metalloprotease [Candidatus Brockarchaeota archaeon]
MLSFKWLNALVSVLIIILIIAFSQTSASGSQGSSITIKLIDEKPLVEISGGIFNFIEIAENLKAHGYELRKSEKLSDGSYLITFPISWSDSDEFLLIYDLTEILPHLAKPVIIAIEYPSSLQVVHNLTEACIYENKQLLIAVKKVEVTVWTLIFSIIVLFAAPSLCAFAIALWSRRVLKLSRLEEYQVASKKVNKLMIIFNYAPAALLLMGFLIVFLPTPPLLGLPSAISVAWRVSFIWATALAFALTLFAPLAFLLLTWTRLHGKYLKPILKEIPPFRKMLEYEKDVKKFSLVANLLPLSLIFIIIVINSLAYDPLSKFIQPLFLQQFLIIIGFLMGFVGMSLIIDLSSRKGMVAMDERLLRIFLEAVSKVGLKKAPPIIKVRTFYGTVANAGVIGLFRRKVVVTETAEKNLDDEELSTIILHEIGHIKYNHMPIAIVFALVFVFTVGNSYGFIADFLKTLKQAFNASEILIMLVTISVYIALFISWFLMLYFVIRVFERKADDFVLKIGINPEAYVKALVKLSVLNLIPIEASKGQEAFQTHPTVIKRLRKVAAKYGVSEERLKELVDTVIKELYEDRYGEGSRNDVKAS